MTGRVERFSVLPGGPPIWVRDSDYGKLLTHHREVRDALLERVARGQQAEAERDQLRERLEGRAAYLRAESRNPARSGYEQRFCLDEAVWLGKLLDLGYWTQSEDNG